MGEAGLEVLDGLAHESEGGHHVLVGDFGALGVGGNSFVTLDQFGLAHRINGA